MGKGKFFLIGFINVLLACLLLSYLHYQHAQHIQMFVANRLYSAWGLELREEVPIERLVEQLPPHSRVFFEHPENDNIRWFYQTGDWQPPLVEGSFFNSPSPSYMAVVGRYHVPEGKPVIEIEGITYDIVGILGAGYPSALDRLVLLHALPENLSSRRVVLDTRRAADARHLQEAFEVGELMADGQVQDILDTGLLNEAVHWAMALLAGMLSLLAGYLYRVVNQNKNRALFLLGQSRWGISLRGSLELLMNLGLAFFLVFLVDHLSGVKLFISSLGFIFGIALLMLLSYHLTYWLGKFDEKGEWRND